MIALFILLFLIIHGIVSVEEGLVERAAVLAEKFKEFELLIEMCIDSNDMDRLYGYIDKYPNEVCGLNNDLLSSFIVFFTVE